MRNVASSWTQTGHLAGRTFKKRQTVTPTPCTVAFGLYLAHLVGFRGASYLESKPLSAAKTEVDAVSGRLQQAIEQAAQRLEPQVQPVPLERATLRTEADVNAWLDRTKQKLMQAVRQGPVLIK